MSQGPGRPGRATGTARGTGSQGRQRRSRTAGPFGACLPCCARPVRRYRVSTPMARPSACRFPARTPRSRPQPSRRWTASATWASCTSITIGADGFGLISYYDTNSALKVACNDTRCTAPTTTTLDDVGVVTDTSITIGGIDDLGLISYYDAVHALLKVAHCTNPACTSATITTLDTSSEGYYASITTGADGLGLIGYQDLTAKALGMAHCDNPACHRHHHETRQRHRHQREVYFTTIGTDGFGLIVHGEHLDLKVTHCENTACTSGTSQAMGLPVPSGPAIAAGHDGRGLVSFIQAGSSERGLWAAHCNNAACTDTSLAMLAEFGIFSTGEGDRTSLTIGGDHRGLISYYEPTSSDLRVAHCADTACTSATNAVVDHAGAVGRFSIATGADGFGLIAYHDSTSAISRSRIAATLHARLEGWHPAKPPWLAATH